MLQQIGLEPERVRLFNLSSAMGGAFAAAATEMTGQVEALGPNPLRRAANGSPTSHQEMSS